MATNSISSSILHEAWAASIQRLSKREQLRRAEQEVYRRFSVFKAYQPLQHGIHHDLQQALPVFPPEVIQRVLQWHCARVRYLKALRAGGARYNLAGEAVALVSDEEQAQAAIRLASLDEKQGVSSAGLETTTVKQFAHGLTFLPVEDIPVPDTLIFCDITDAEPTEIPTTVPPPASLATALPVATASPWLAQVVSRPASACPQKPKTYAIGQRRLVAIKTEKTLILQRVTQQLRHVLVDLGGECPPGLPPRPEPLPLAFPSRHRVARQMTRPLRSQSRARHAQYAAQNQPTSIKLPPIGVK